MSTIQLRRGTAAQWTSADPVLASGEAGYETDTNKFKIGDGSTIWSLLSYFSGDIEGTAVLSTGEVGGTKFLREDGDGTCSWQTVAAGGDVSSSIGVAVDGDVAIFDSTTGKLIKAATTTAGTGTAITLALTGRYYNTGTPSTSTSYTTTGATQIGAWARARSSSATASEPTVTGATKEGGIEWQAGVEYDIFIVRDDEGVKFSFIPTATSVVSDFISGIIEVPVDQSYKLVVKVPYAGQITETTTISTAGTCTATFKINTTALGGTANSVSSSEQSQAHSTSNTFAAGDDIVLTVSANSSCANMSFTIKFNK